MARSNRLNREVHQQFVSFEPGLLNRNKEDNLNLAAASKNN